MNTKPEMIKPEHYDDSDEGRVVDTVDINALTQLNAAEINQQIMTARAYPRSITGFRRSMREMVTYDQPTALSCLYALKRSGKVIEGPSIRFAEAALQSWGNARAGARIVDVGDDFITAQGFFYDLEKNMALVFEVMRRITNREGERYGDDMIGVTGNAACSIAIRNAILRGVPKTAWNESYQDARMLSIGKGESITLKREGMIKAFAPLGVDKEQIFGLLGVKGIDDVSVDDMIFMGGILNAIKEGETTVEKEFAPENMQNLNEVAPRRPQRSEFDRGKPADSDKGKSTTGSQAGTETGGGDKTETAKTEGQKPEGQNAEGTAETKAAGADEPVRDSFREWFADELKRFEECTTVREVCAVRDEIEPEVKDNKEMAAELIKVSDARMSAIKAAAKKK